jgi:hypothetical protein
MVPLAVLAGSNGIVGTISDFCNCTARTIVGSNASVVRAVQLHKVHPHPAQQLSGSDHQDRKEEHKGDRSATRGNAWEPVTWTTRTDVSDRSDVIFEADGQGFRIYGVEAAKPLIKVSWAHVTAMLADDPLRGAKSQTRLHWSIWWSGHLDARGTWFNNPTPDVPEEFAGFGAEKLFLDNMRLWKLFLQEAKVPMDSYEAGVPEKALVKKTVRDVNALSGGQSSAVSTAVRLKQIGYNGQIHAALLERKISEGEQRIIGSLFGRGGFL